MLCGREAKKCSICGASALNRNLGGLSCESCKVFFRRTALKFKKYDCKHANNCEIVANARKCIACRLNRCFEVGMRKELINLKISAAKKARSAAACKTRPETMTKTVVVPDLTRYEWACIKQIGENMKVFPSERAILQLGLVTRIVNCIESANQTTVYIKPIIKFANCFEPFRQLDTLNQVQLIKPFFDAFLTVRCTLNLLPNGREFPMLADEQGKKCFVMDWEQVCTQLIRDHTWTIKVRQMMHKLREALNVDTAAQNIFMVALLFQANHQTVSNEYIHYYHTFYITLLRRYLVTTHPNNVHTGIHKYSRLVDLFSLCREARSLSDVFFKKIEHHQLSHLIAELYEIDK